MLLRQIPDDTLAQYAYLIGCQRTGEALVIDPERDVDRYIHAAEAEGLRLTAAAETHIHADFLSGARELASRGLTVYLSDAGDADWKYAWPQQDGAAVRWLTDGDTFQIGHIELRTLHTPGHTPEHLSFLVTDRGAGADVPLGLATGDFVFVGDVGRPDLLETAAGIAGAMRPSAARLATSLRELAHFPDSLLLWPGHGAGSACGKALGAVPISSLGYERRFNHALRLANENPASFIDAILDGQPDPPLYFATMKRLNKLGPPVLRSLPTPARLTPADLIEHAGRRDTVVLDTRPARRAFMTGHLAGSLRAPLDRSFATVVGSYVRPEEPLVLLLDPKDLDNAVRQLVRIGFDNIAGHATLQDLEVALHSDHAPLARTAMLDCAAMSAVGPGFLVVDVRSPAEFRANHVPGAVNIPHTRLLQRLSELPRDRSLVVHCASGARAAVAVAALERHGFDVRYVDDACVGRRE
jgi:hydroxyacylglutathione hydrolase